MVGEVLVFIAFGLAPVGGLALLLLLYNIFRAPPRMEKVTQDQIAKTEKELRQSYQTEKAMLSEKVESLQSTVNEIIDARPSIKTIGLYDSKSIRWYVANDGGSAKFRATGQKVENGILVGRAWPIRWEGTAEESKQIDSRGHAVLEIASIGFVLADGSMGRYIVFPTARFVAYYSSDIHHQPVYAHEIRESPSISRMTIHIELTADNPLREACSGLLTIFLTDDGRIEVELPN